MRQRTTQLVMLGGVAGMCAILLGFASESPADSGAVASVVAAPSPLQALPGDLPKPLGQMTSDELWTTGNGLQFDNGPVQGRNCRRGACMGRIDAVRNQTPGAANISANGTIVARLVNLGRAGSGDDDGIESKYGMEKDGAARYYLIALRTAGGGWSWTVRKATTQDANPPGETASGSWVTCTHDPANAGHPKGRSEFARCPIPIQKGDGGGSASNGPHASLDADFSAAVTRYNPLDPGWLSCSDGCCTAGL